MTQPSRYTHTRDEVEAILTSYMRLAHDVGLEKIDHKLVTRLCTSADHASAHEVAPEVELAIEILEVKGTQVRMHIPARWPIMAHHSRENTYAAAHIAGAPVVGKKFCDLEHMVTLVDLTRSVRLGKRVTDQLKAGQTATLADLSGEQAQVTWVNTPPQEVAPEVKPEKAVKLTRAQRRVADHLEGRCFCDKPQGHMCPAVREKMLDSTS